MLLEDSPQQPLAERLAAGVSARDYDLPFALRSCAKEVLTTGLCHLCERLAAPIVKFLS